MMWRWLVPVVAALGLLAAGADEAAAGNPLDELTDGAADAAEPVLEAGAGPGAALNDASDEVSAPAIAIARPAVTTVLTSAAPLVEPALEPLAPIIRVLAPVSDRVGEALDPPTRPAVPQLVDDHRPIPPRPELPLTPPLEAQDAAAPIGPASSTGTGDKAVPGQQPEPLPPADEDADPGPGIDEAIRWLAGALDAPVNPIPAVTSLVAAFGALLTRSPLAAEIGRWQPGRSVPPPVPPG